jgi:hypothetical protein
MVSAAEPTPHVGPEHEERGVLSVQEEPPLIVIATVPPVLQVTIRFKLTEFTARPFTTSLNKLPLNPDVTPFLPMLVHAILPLAWLDLYNWLAVRVKNTVRVGSAAGVGLTTLIFITPKSCVLMPVPHEDRENHTDRSWKFGEYTHRYWFGYADSIVVVVLVATAAPVPTYITLKSSDEIDPSSVPMSGRLINMASESVRETTRLCTSWDTNPTFTTRLANEAPAS